MDSDADSDFERDAPLSKKAAREEAAARRKLDREIYERLKRRDSSKK